MFVIAFDLNANASETHHPKGSRQAYRDLEKVLKKHGFERAQWSVFVAKNESLVDLIKAVHDIKQFDWFASCVKNVRAFRMEQGTDLTSLFLDTDQSVDER